MEITIPVQLAVYLGITIGFMIGFFIDLFKTEQGGNFYSGKRSGEMGLIGILSFFVWLVFTAIWGGVFWW